MSQRTPEATGGPSVQVLFGAIVLAMLPAVLDQTILATALPTIAADLGRLSDVSWVVSAYVVAAAAATPLWGKLGDRHGRKRLLELSLVLFLSSSAACGLATGMPVLVGARLAQGVAAGGLMTLAMAAVGDLVSARERGRYQGYIAATFAVATVAGPLLGGLVVDSVSWRWVFYLNLPLGLLALAGLSRLPAPAPPPAPSPLDVLGAVLLAGGTSALLLACIWGGGRYAWGSAPILGVLAGAAALGGALVLRERRAGDPIVPVGLLRRRTVAVAAGGLFLATAALFAVNVFVPLLLQTTTGASPTEAGLLLVPMMIGITLSTNLAGRAIEATGRYRHYPPIGLALMTVSLAALAVLTARPARGTTAIGIAVFGLGFGMVGQVLTVAVQNDVDRRQLGTAMATITFFRGLGGAVGAAALGAVFAARGGSAAGTAGHLQVLAGAGRAELVPAVQTVFWVAAPIAAVGLLGTLLLPGTPLAGPTGGASTAPRRRAPRATLRGTRRLPSTRT